MPSQETIEKFIARVEANAHAEAIAEFYTESASMRENRSPPRIGRDLLVAHEQKFLARMSGLTSTCIRPVLLNGDIVVVRWNFHFDFPDGTSVDLDELAYQRWEGERIGEERFFYDPAQLVPRKPDGAGASRS